MRLHNERETVLRLRKKVQARSSPVPDQQLKMQNSTLKIRCNRLIKELDDAKTQARFHELHSKGLSNTIDVLTDAIDYGRDRVNDLNM